MDCLTPIIAQARHTRQAAKQAHRSSNSVTDASHAGRACSTQRSFNLRGKAQVTLVRTGQRPSRPDASHAGRACSGVCEARTPRPGSTPHARRPCLTARSGQSGSGRPVAGCAAFPGATAGRWTTVAKAPVSKEPGADQRHFMLPPTQIRWAKTGLWGSILSWGATQLRPIHKID
jgi:hypothetical protein